MSELPDAARAAHCRGQVRFYPRLKQLHFYKRPCAQYGLDINYG